MKYNISYNQFSISIFSIWISRLQLDPHIINKEVLLGQYHHLPQDDIFSSFEYFGKSIFQEKPPLEPNRGWDQRESSTAHDSKNRFFRS